MIGQSPRFLAVVKLIERIAACDAPVLIEGETGTGKELAARAIHYGGARRDKAFVPVNCGGLAENLIENELFGHSHGAYTDAGGERPGLLNLADGGTLFLDEVDSLPARGQVALLRFLQDGKFRPLGCQREHSADVRLIVAANRRLETLVEAGNFRADLLFRLRVLSVEMPPLRERPGDPSLLAEHFLRVCAARYGKNQSTLDGDARVWLESYGWPGNVRELENLIHRELLLAEDHHLHLSKPENVPIHGGSQRTAQHESGTFLLPYALARAQVLDSFDRQYLMDLLRRTQGNVTQAALLAGKERRALGKLLKKCRINSTQFRG